MVVLGTAHPAKFPEAVKRAAGREAEIPERLRERLHGPERVTLLANSAKAVAEKIAAHAAA
jgi:threonine synthase